MKKKLKKIIASILPNFYEKLVEIKKNKIINQFKNDYPHTKIFTPIHKNDRKIYSQDNQDYIVYEHFFKDKKDGFFCDIGGNHPLTINNTRYFEEQGWNGIAFEPLPHMKELWEIHRKAKLFPFALSDQEGEVSFTVVKSSTGWEDMLSFVKDTREIEYDYDTEEIKVQTKRFKDVIEKERINHIDYLSLDVEGHELNVLKGIDFSQIKINVITIENNPPSSMIYGDKEIRKLMVDNNFVLWGRIMGLDDIYVNKLFLQTNNSKEES